MGSITSKQHQTGELRARRLRSGDRELARKVFVLMAETFGEESESLSDAYIDQLLEREDFWALAAFLGDEPAGGLTAHTLPMTRTESSEIFIYDIAVRDKYQRRGIGRQLVTALRSEAAAAGIHQLFVPADNDDFHALDFYRSLGGLASPVTFFTFSAAEE